MPSAIQKMDFSKLKTEFWAILVDSQKRYSQVVSEKFHVTMAALDPSVNPTSSCVSLMVQVKDIEYLLCSLKPGSILQSNLDLFFDKGERISFFLKGRGTVHLTGYKVCGQSNSVSEDIFIKDEVPKTNKALKTDATSPKKSPAKMTMGDTKVLVEEQSSESSSEESEEEKAVTSSSGKLPKAPPAKTGKKLAQVEEEDSDDDDLSMDDEEEGEEDDEEQEIPKFSMADSDDDDEESDDEDEELSDEETKATLGNLKRKAAEQKQQASGKTLNDKKKLKLSNEQTPNKSDGKHKKGKKQLDDSLLNSSIGKTPMPKLKTPSSFNQTEMPSSAKKKNKAANDTSFSSPSPNKKLDSSEKLNTSLGKVKFANKLPLGVEYEDLRVGNGPPAKKGRLVHAHYVGRLESGKVFDSNKEGQKPFAFRLGQSEVIKGWDLGFEGMKVGGKRKLKIPPKAGYGNKRMGDIPPSSTLLFTVELKAVS